MLSKSLNTYAPQTISEPTWAHDNPNRYFHLSEVILLIANRLYCLPKPPARPDGTLPYHATFHHITIRNLCANILDQPITHLNCPEAQKYIQYQLSKDLPHLVIKAPSSTDLNHPSLYRTEIFRWLIKLEAMGSPPWYTIAPIRTFTPSQASFNP